MRRFRRQPGRLTLGQASVPRPPYGDPLSGIRCFSEGQPGRLTYVGQASRLSLIDGRSNRVSPLIVILHRDLRSNFLSFDFRSGSETRRESGRLEERIEGSRLGFPAERDETVLFRGSTGTVDLRRTSVSHRRDRIRFPPLIVILVELLVFDFRSRLGDTTGEWEIGGADGIGSRLGAARREG